MEIPNSKAYIDSEDFSKDLDSAVFIASKDTEAVLLYFEMEDRIDFLNSYAIFISDNNINAAIPIIINKIKSGKFKGFLGTLVYALEELDIQDYFFDILDFSIINGYEVFEMSLCLFDKIIDQIDKKDLKVGVSKLTKIVSIHSEENEYRDYLIRYLKNPSIRK